MKSANIPISPFAHCLHVSILHVCLSYSLKVMKLLCMRQVTTSNKKGVVRSVNPTRKGVVEGCGHRNGVVNRNYC